MRTLSELAFDYGFFPVIHNSVKQDFLSWYYEGSKTSIAREGLDVENSQLAKLALRARIEAENYKKVNELSQLVDIMEGWISRFNLIFYYLAAFAIISGAGMSAPGILELKSTFVSWAVRTLGAILLIGGVSTVVLYNVLTHQIKTNSDLITRFNKELTEKPGEVRENDQHWNQLAAQFFWNRSLLSPRTHIGPCLDG